MMDDIKYCITSFEQCPVTHTSDIGIENEMHRQYGFNEVHPSVRLHENIKRQLSPLLLINRALENQTHQKLSGQFIIDFSSVKPSYEAQTDTFKTKIEELAFEMDIPIHLPPVKRITRVIKHKNSRMATPKSIEI